ncbi:hypothetical protein GCM10022404_25380 [Celeribacter arenosi]|uniref:AAA domain-containing protein n=2 Tax=Celeribacter arenosi TaxID=792649 RepID=A0ABP7KDZ9_9RHOB
MVAPSNVGKTALAVTLGAQVVQGLPVLDMPTRKGVVVHICGEGGDAVKDRIHAALKGATDAEDYLVIKDRFALGDPEQIAAFIQGLRTHLGAAGGPVSLIIVDTLIHAIGDMNENSSNEMALVVSGAQEIAEALDAHVLLVHHTGREEDRGGRGSSAIRSNVDSEFSVRKDDETQEVILTTTKQRNMENGMRFSYRLKKVLLGFDDENYERSTVVAELIDGSSRMANCSPTLNAHQIAILSVLRALNSGGVRPLPTTALKPLIAVAEWTSNADEKAQLAAFRNVLSGLETKGLVSKVKIGKEVAWSLPQAS